MRHESKGSLTVEAVLIIPFLIGVFVVFMYLGIYMYDKTLIVQDANSIAVLIRDKSLLGDKSEEDITESAFSELVSEHPYIAINNLSVKIKESGQQTSIIMKGDWELPVYKVFRKTIKYEKKIERVEPVTTMYTVEFISMLMGRRSLDDW